MMLANFRNDCSALFRVLFTVMVLTLGISGVHANVVINSFNSATDWGNNKTTPNLLTLAQSGFSNTNLEANKNLLLAVSNGTGTVTMDVPSLAGMQKLLLSMKSGDAAEEEIDIGVFDGSWHDVGLEGAGYGSLGGEYSPFNIPLADFNANVSEITKVRVTFSATSLHSIRIDHICAATQNIAIGKTPVLTDDEGQYDADLAVDGNRITRWGTSHLVNYWVNHWIKVDLGSNNNVNGVYIHWETAAAAEYTVEVSQDCLSWTTVATITNGVSAESRYLDFASVTSRYVRVNCTKKTSEIYGYSIWELEVYGQTIPVPAAPSNLVLQIASASQINLTWTDNATDETGYYVYKNTSNNKAGAVKYTLGSGSQGYSATGLTPETQYYFWVEAYNAHGSSAAISGNITLNYGGFIADDFNRDDSEVLNGGWIEVEGTDLTAKVLGQKMQLSNGDSDSLRPLVKKLFPLQSGGYLEWSFIMDWTRSSESTYEVRMQLGSDMTDNNISQGVGVDLRWGDNNEAGWQDEGGFGYVNSAGQEIQVSSGAVSGPTVVKVVANLNDKVFDIYLGGQLMLNGAPFRNAVSISQARFFTKNVGSGIIGRTFDNITLNTEDYYTINASAGSGGSIAPSGKVCVPSGGEKVFSISYDQNQYKVASFAIDGNPATYSPSYTFSNVTSEGHSIAVTFAALQVFTITTTVTGEGTITPSNPQVTEGRDARLIFTPAAGSEIEDVIVNGNSVGKVTFFDFLEMAGNATVKAVFGKYLPLIGGTMMGPIDMNGNFLENIPFLSTDIHTNMDGTRHISLKNDGDIKWAFILDNETVGTGVVHDDFVLSWFNDDQTLGDEAIRVNRNTGFVKIKNNLYAGLVSVGATGGFSQMATTGVTVGYDNAALGVTGTVNVGFDPTTACRIVTNEDSEDLLGIRHYGIQQGGKLRWAIGIAHEGSVGDVIQKNNFAIYRYHDNSTYKDASFMIDNGTGDVTVTNNLEVKKELSVETVITRSWKIQPADFVFEPDYDLRDLKEVESFVKQNRHLPDVPSGKEMQEKGLDLAAMNMQLLRKVEELVLYAIEMEKNIKKYEEKISAQEGRINRIESILSKE